MLSQSACLSVTVYNVNQVLLMSPRGVLQINSSVINSRQLRVGYMYQQWSYADSLTC